MKATVIPSAVLAGQGCGGSYGLGVPNPAPPTGPMGGDKNLEPEEQIGNASANSAGLAPKAGTQELDPMYGSFANTIDGNSPPANTGIAAKGGDL